MKEWDISRTFFSVGDFLSWMNSGSLNLDPPFQRRSVWKSGAKSYFIDTLLRGLPVPTILIRETRDSQTYEPIRDVIDGQQRLKTVISFINPELLTGGEPFKISKSHNKEFGGCSFEELPLNRKDALLDYRFSVHILPSDLGDKEVLEIFSRMNSTGIKLNAQELRNAAFFGEMKSSVYDLSFQSFERWIKWELFSESSISRMAEVEMMGELYHFIMNGVTTRTKASIDRLYEDYDDVFHSRVELESRIENVLGYIENNLSNLIPKSHFKIPTYFIVLFMFVYDLIYGVNSAPNKATKKKVPAKLVDTIISVDRKLKSNNLPKKLLEEKTKRRLKDKLFRIELLKFFHKEL